jgi:anti-anti-sigma regulatory factor
VQCRIDVRDENDGRVVQLAGRLAEAQVPALLEACGGAHAPPVLELSELVSADAVGIDALLRVEQMGARLVGVPEYIRLTLDAMARERR